MAMPNRLPPKLLDLWKLGFHLTSSPSTPCLTSWILCLAWIQDHGPNSNSLRPGPGNSGRLILEKWYLMEPQKSNLHPCCPLLTNIWLFFGERIWKFIIWSRCTTFKLLYSLCNWVHYVTEIIATEELQNRDFVITHPWISIKKAPIEGMHNTKMKSNIQ